MGDAFASFYDCVVLVELRYLRYIRKYSAPRERVLAMEEVADTGDNDVHIIKYKPEADSHDCILYINTPRPQLIQ